MKKMLFVMNPYAGQRRANRYLADILSIFNRAGYRVESYMTGARGEATDIVRQYAPEMDLVACCGGDGTFNETVNGLLHRKSTSPWAISPPGPPMISPPVWACPPTFCRRRRPSSPGNPPSGRGQIR